MMSQRSSCCLRQLAPAPLLLLARAAAGLGVSARPACALPPQHRPCSCIQSSNSEAGSYAAGTAASQRTNYLDNPNTQPEAVAEVQPTQPASQGLPVWRQPYAVGKAVLVLFALGVGMVGALVAAAVRALMRCAAPSNGHAFTYPVQFNIRSGIQKFMETGNFGEHVNTALAVAGVLYSIWISDAFIAPRGLLKDIQECSLLSKKLALALKQNHELEAELDRMQRTQATLHKNWTYVAAAQLHTLSGLRAAHAARSANVGGMGGGQLPLPLTFDDSSRSDEDPACGP